MTDKSYISFDDKFMQSNVQICSCNIFSPKTSRVNVELSFPILFAVVQMYFPESPLVTPGMVSLLLSELYM